MRQQLTECEKAIDNMLNAIQMGVLTASTKERLEKLEMQREELKLSILQAQMARPRYTKEQVVSWISRFKYGNVDDPQYQKQIIDTFINSIYVFDDKLVFTYNFKDGTETITLAEIQAAFGSDLTQVAPPRENLGNLVFPRFFSFLMDFSMSVCDGHFATLCFRMLPCFRSQAVLSCTAFGA